MSTLSYPFEIRTGAGTLLASWDRQWGFRGYTSGDVRAYLFMRLRYKNDEDIDFEDRKAAGILAQIVLELKREYPTQVEGIRLCI